MKRGLIVLAVVIILAACSGSATIVTAEETPNPLVVEDTINSLQYRMDMAHLMAEAARGLAYDEEHYVIQLAQSEYLEAEQQIEKLQRFLESWHQKEEEYPTASYVWAFLKNEGYSDIVCAGIIGNMMVEAGHGESSLALNWAAYGSNGFYYGLCQWNRDGYPSIHGADLKTQCEFLRQTIEYNFEVCGKLYRPGFTYEDFLAMTDPYEAAVAFCKCYERGAGHDLRGRCARIAYSYYTD